MGWEWAGFLCGLQEVALGSFVRRRSEVINEGRETVQSFADIRKKAERPSQDPG